MISYGGHNWSEFDIGEMNQLVEGESGNYRPCYRSAEERAFFEKFKAVGGFSGKPVIADNDQTRGSIAVVGYDLNHATISNIRIAFENPPAKDYPKMVSTWFRAKWWSVPLVLLGVILPLLTGYWTLIVALRNYLLNWLNGEPPEVP